MDGGCAHELNLRRLKWVLIIEPKLQCEHLSLVKGVLSAFKLDMPDSLGLINNIQLEYPRKIVVNVFGKPV